MSVHQHADPAYRERIFFSYLLSIALHGIFAALFFIVPTSSSRESASETTSGQPIIITVRSVAAHVRRPRTATPPRAQAAVPAPRELAVIVKRAPPRPRPLKQATPQPVPVVTQAPLVPLPSPSPAPVPTAVALAVRVTAPPSATPIPSPKPQPSPAPTVAPTIAPTIVPSPAQTLAPSPAPHPKHIASPAPHGARTPGPQAGSPRGGKSTPSALLAIRPTPRPRARPTAHPKRTGLNAKLKGMIPHNAVLPSMRSFGPRYGSLVGDTVPQPSAAIRAATKYLYRASGRDRILMWVTSIHRTAFGWQCHGWLVRFPYGPPSRASAQGPAGPNGITLGGGIHTVASGSGVGLAPIIEADASYPCSRRALAPYLPRQASP